MDSLTNKLYSAFSYIASPTDGVQYQRTLTTKCVSTYVGANGDHYDSSDTGTERGPIQWTKCY